MIVFVFADIWLIYFILNCSGGGEKREMRPTHDVNVVYLSHMQQLMFASMHVFPRMQDMLMDIFKLRISKRRLIKQ